MATEQSSTGATILPFKAKRRRGRPRKPSGTSAVVLGLVSPTRGRLVYHDVVAELERVLAHARRGHISGIAWITSSPPGSVPHRYCAGLVGEPKRDPDLGFTMTLKLWQKAAAAQESAWATAGAKD